MQCTCSSPSASADLEFALFPQASCCAQLVGTSCLHRAECNALCFTPKLAADVSTAAANAAANINHLQTGEEKQGINQVRHSSIRRVLRHIAILEVAAAVSVSFCEARNGAQGARGQHQLPYSHYKEAECAQQPVLNAEHWVLTDSTESTPAHLSVSSIMSICACALLFGGAPAG